MAPTPPPATPAATIVEDQNANSDRRALRAKRKGRSALAIPLDVNVSGGSKNGVNVPS